MIKDQEGQDNILNEQCDSSFSLDLFKKLKDIEANSGNKLQLRMAKTQPEGNSFLNSNFEDQE